MSFQNHRSNCNIWIDTSSDGTFTIRLSITARKIQQGKVGLSYLGFFNRIQMSPDAAISPEFQESGGAVKFFSREKVCKNSVLPVFTKVITRVYSDLYFDIEAKRRADIMINSIRNAFDNGLSTVPWMDENTRKLARKKVRRSLM